jgi:hypothetical protein
MALSFFDTFLMIHKIILKFIGIAFLPLLALLVTTAQLNWQSED